MNIWWYRAFSLGIQLMFGILAAKEGSAWSALGLGMCFGATAAETYAKRQW